ncbi:MAG: hypothetical protein OSJ63_00415 [Bacilli bacterium]|nr:hypothetical protein [Bacilli bacterium]
MNTIANNEPLTAAQITSLINDLEGLVEDYKTAQIRSSYNNISMHNVLAGINNYEQQIINTYHGFNLYQIYANIKEHLYDSDCKVHILIVLENRLLAEILESYNNPDNELIASFTEQGINIISTYCNARKCISSNAGNSFNQAVANIYTYVEQVCKLSKFEKTAILQRLYHQYNSNLNTLPKAVLTMLNSIKNSIFEEAYNQDLFPRQ